MSTPPEMDGAAPDAKGAAPKIESPPSSTIEAHRSAPRDYFQPMPALSAEEYAALRNDITARGVLVPVLADQHGRIIDGHHRQRVCDELGIDCPVEVREVADDSEAMDLAVTLNAARRQLNREQKRHLVRAEIARRPGDSDRAIARRVGCSPSIVGAVRNGRPSNLDTPAPDAQTSRPEPTDDPPSEAELAAQLVRIIEDRYAEDPDTWLVPHELGPYIEVCWPWPTHPQHIAHRDVAYRLFLCCPPTSPVWDLLDIWLHAVAQPALDEYADLEREHPRDDGWPGRKLAELCLVVCNPRLPVETRVMLHQQLQTQVAFAVIDCERLLDRQTIAHWRSVAGLDETQGTA